VREAAAASGPTLVVVVVNGREDASPEVHAANERLLRALRSAGRPAGDPFDLLVIDRASPGRRLSAREGVGRARKIGSDVALALRAAGRLESEWIHGSDADAVQPPDRFTAVEAAGSDSVAAVVHPFVHLPSGDAALDGALRRYDRSLRYWVAGLEWAGSPYAFHAIGSALAVRAEHYARVRGFPDRQAGEDFWMLNKLAKVGRVVEAPGAPIALSARVSDRVPFGTGAALARILEDDRRGEPFRTYDPRCFARLRAWLGAAGRWAREGVDPVDAAGGAIDADLARRRVEQLRAQHEGDDLLRAFHVWFDGFRTMKLVHAVRDREYPDVPLEDAIAAAPFVTPAS